MFSYTTSGHGVRIFSSCDLFRIVDDVVYVEWVSNNETRRKSQHDLAKDVMRSSREDVEIMNFYRLEETM